MLICEHLFCIATAGFHLSNVFESRESIWPMPFRSAMPELDLKWWSYWIPSVSYGCPIGNEWVSVYHVLAKNFMSMSSHLVVHSRNIRQIADRLCFGKEKGIYCLTRLFFLAILTTVIWECAVQTLPSQLFQPPAPPTALTNNVTKHFPFFKFHL